MPWTLTEEQLAYQEALSDWLAKTADTTAVRTWLDDGDGRSFADRFVADGWWGVGVAEEYDGQGGGLVELALTAEALGHCAAPSSVWLAAVVAAPLARGWSDEGFSALLVPADSIPHLAAPLTLDGDRITGEVRHVLAAGQAASFVVPVDGALRAVAAADVQVTPRKLLDRSRSAADVRLDGVSSQPLEADPDLLIEAAARLAVLVAADALGASARMLDLAVEYAGQRQQFGVKIGSFQAVKHAAATMLVGVEAARSVVPFAAASVDAAADERDPLWLLHAAAAKSQVTAEAARAADSALTLHGAIGYTWEHDLQLFYKRAKLDAVLGGPPGSWDDLIADGLALT